MTGINIAGIRTFGLIALLGGLWEIFARGLDEILLGFAFLAFVVLVVISHVAEARVSKDYGGTTLIAALITFVLGALSVRGHHTVAAVAGVVTTALLNPKPLLHHWLQRIEAHESTASEALQLRNPVELTQAVKFGLLLAAVLLASKAAQAWRGDSGLYVLAAIAGISDVDAITISLAILEPPNVRKDRGPRMILWAIIPMMTQLLFQRAITIWP